MTITATINVVTGILTVGDGSDEQINALTGTDGGVTDRAELEPWGEEEEGLGRADDALYALGLRRVGPWITAGEESAATVEVVTAAGPVDQEIASELAEAIWQMQSESPSQGGLITAAIASWDRRIIVVRSAMCPSDRWVTLHRGEWTLPVMQAAVLGLLAAEQAREIRIGPTGTVSWFPPAR